MRRNRGGISDETGEAVPPAAVRGRLLSGVRAISVLLAFTAVALPACADRTKRPAPPETGPPDVILITIDTLRDDHLSCYGSTSTSTPRLDGLAWEGALFEQTWATSNWTKPSMASLFTSLDPLTHRVRKGFGKDDVSHREELLPDAYLTLAEAMRGAGYRTFGISSNGLLSEATGFAQGFDSFDGLGFTVGRKVNEALAARIDALRESRPYFLWIHYFDPHGPYYPRDLEERAALEARIAKETGKSGPEFPEAFRKQLARRAYSSDLLVREEAVKTARRLYAGEVELTDELVGAALALIPRSEEALVVLTADHGEQFREHGHMEHGKGLFGEEINVPLLIRFPGTVPAGTRISTPVSILDLPPTILDLAGLPPREEFAGRSLATAARGETDQGVLLFAEVDRSEVSKSAALRDGRFKYLRHFVQDWERLFDLESDPGETRDLSAQEPELVSALRARIERAYAQFEERGGEAPTRALDEEEVERLRALGYVED